MVLMAKQLPPSDFSQEIWKKDRALLAEEMHNLNQQRSTAHRSFDNAHRNLNPFDTFPGIGEESYKAFDEKWQELNLDQYLQDLESAYRAYNPWESQDMVMYVRARRALIASLTDLVKKTKEHDHSRENDDRETMSRFLQFPLNELIDSLDVMRYRPELVNKRAELVQETTPDA